MTLERLAVVLFNLGGPDSPEAIRPFLHNLFNDPAIISLPQPARRLLATLISRRREKTAREIYARLGGASPLLEQTNAQATALEATLRSSGFDARVFVCMRYWSPRSPEVAVEVARFAPDRLVLLPLYPQFSTSTTASSLADWRSAALEEGVHAPTAAICCYPEQPGFLLAVAEAVAATLAEAPAEAPLRLLFSAHGLPERIVRRGDPYPRQVEATARGVARLLAAPPFARPDLDWKVCYQSRVGPLKWTGPSTEDEIRRAAADGVGVLVAPIAFVSEHSETLVELDIEYRALAERTGAPFYLRAPTVGTSAPFIDGLARLVQAALHSGAPIGPGEGRHGCDAAARACPCRSADAPLAVG